MNAFTSLEILEIDHSQYSKVRLVVTVRKPKNDSVFGSDEQVILESEDGSGLVVAIFGKDSPAARADAARMMALWNGALNS